jgi:hypothetical protein
MPIEDVQYLLENSVHDSSMVFIDSAQRNRRYHPTPSEYVVDFEEPMRNVFGMDVLDATIPATMYSIDAHNDHLMTVRVDSTRSSLVQRARQASDPSDTEAREAAETGALGAELYTLGLNEVFTQYCIGDPKRDASVMVMDGDAFDALSRESEAALPMPSESDPIHSVRYGVFVRHAILGAPLYRSTGSLAANAPGAFERDGEIFAVASPESGGMNALLVEWIERAVATHRTFAVVPTTLSPTTLSQFTGSSRFTSMYDIVFYEYVPITKDEFDSYGEASDSSALDVRLTLIIRNIRLEHGNYRITTLQPVLRDRLLSSLGIDVSSTTTASIERQGIMRFKAGDANSRFIFVTGSSTSAQMLGFDVFPDMDEGKKPARDRRYQAVVFGKESRAAFMSTLKLDAQAEVQVLDAPGIVNLLGVRYITLRCKEIEDHMGAVGKYGRFSTGVGVFKLASVSEVASLRFDFVSLIRKPFHPIGKLTRLTLRFEMTSGELYDFKGVNHQILITIKYYVPQLQKSLRFESTILNPEYDPDFMAYVNSQTRDEARVQEQGFDDDPSSHHDSASEEDTASEEDSASEEDASDGGSPP